MYIGLLRKWGIGLVMLLGLSGCLSPKKSYSEITSEGLLKETTVQGNTSARKCIRKETVQFSDTTTQQITAKTITILDCKGAWSQVIRCKKWKQENGKLVRIKDDCKPNTY